MKPAKAGQTREARLKLLAEVGRKTTAILSREELLRSAVQIIKETFDYFMVNIFLVDGEDLVVRACTMPELQKAVNKLRLKIGTQGITGWVAAHGRPQNVPDVRTDPRYSYYKEEELRTRAELAVPITLKGVVIGVLDVQSSQTAAFTDLDTFTLQTVADQLAVAIENARLVEELRKELAYRQGMETLLRSLHAAGLAMEKAPRPDAVFAIAGDQLARLGLSSRLSLADLGARTATPVGGGAPIPLDGVDALCRIAAGEPAAFAPGSIVVPMLFEDRLLGFLEVGSPDLAEDAIPAFQVFANEIATAWRKAELVRDLEESLGHLRSTQEQLLQSQKMEAVGRLAGGVAHDFNNQLTAILGYAEIMLIDLPEGDQRRISVGEIVKAARRAAELIRQLLAFSRKQVLRLRIIDLKALVEDMRDLLSRLIGEHIQLQTSFTGGDLRVRADETQLQQVIVNLAVNARDAMPDGGTLTLETEPLFTGAAREGLPSLPAGEYCLLRVRDTGTGMDKETLRQLFEPFFTTKELGKGTGLGLSTAYGIVKQSGGHIYCESLPGQGATFTICLPRVLESPEKGATPDPTQRVRGGTETVLVVEDEDSVRELITRTLSAAGYVVHAASTAVEGLRLLEVDGLPARLLLTDLLLPGGMSGLELAKHVLASPRGDVRLLCVSGYAEQLATDAVATIPPGSFLQKPFSPAELCRKVREILDRP
jgi:signal transduction histidine kinase